MYQVSKDGAAVLEELYRLLVTQGDHGALTINANGQNSGLMPVHLEIMRISDEDLGRTPGGATMTSERVVFSVAHYYEQNGDLCADPLMEFLRYRTDVGTVFIPVRYKTDGSIFASDRESMVLNESTLKPERVAEKANKEDRVFTSDWMRNIAWQQKLNVKLQKKAV